MTDYRSTLRLAYAHRDRYTSLSPEWEAIEAFIADFVHAEMGTLRALCNEDAPTRRDRGGTSAAGLDLG